MKYCILALSPHNSLQRCLPDPDYTVLGVNRKRRGGVEPDPGMGACSSGHAVRGDARDTCVMER